MTDYGVTVWARIRKPGKCRDCRQPFTWRVNFKTGKFMPFNGVLTPLSTSIDELTQQPLELLSRDDLHPVTCKARKRKKAQEAHAS